jgi:hypothetical protein
MEPTNSLPVPLFVLKKGIVPATRHCEIASTISSIDRVRDRGMRRISSEDKIRPR